MHGSKRLASYKLFPIAYSLRTPTEILVMSYGALEIKRDFNEK